jgi:hypothetical protein
MEQPHGYVHNSSLVCQMKNSLYNLRQAPRQWYAKIDYFLLSHSFTRCKSWPNVYTLSTFDYLLILVLYVYDLLIIGSLASTIVAVKDILHDRFSKTYMGPLHFLLGLEINQDGLDIKLS